jgi:hypothetical protein
MGHGLLAAFEVLSQQGAQMPWRIGGAAVGVVKPRPIGVFQGW